MATPRNFPAQLRERASFVTALKPEQLADELRRHTGAEIRFDEGSRALYATDGSNYRQAPIGVVVPRTLDDVVAAFAVCRQFGAPVLSRGGGTSLAGQCCNVAVVIDYTKYLGAVLEVDPIKRIAKVQPGVVLDDLRKQAERHHLTFGPDPSTHSHCTLGGMIGNNSCGVHSQLAGRTAENVVELEILTYEGHRMRVGPTSELELEHIAREGGPRGEIYARLKTLRDRHAPLIRQRYPKIPRRVSGYNLDELLPENGFNVARALVGSEGTCVAVLEATTRLIPSPRARSLLVLGYEDIYSAGDHIAQINESGPIGLEGMDDNLVNWSELKGLHPGARNELPSGNGWLLVEFGGNDKIDADAQARTLMRRLKKDVKPPAMKLFDDQDQEKRIWMIRETGLGATARVPGEKDSWEGWEDSAVPPAAVGAYLRSLRSLLGKYDYYCALYGHFGHGCIHTRIDFDLQTAAGIQKYRAFVNEATDLVLRYGGSLSGEHGDGQSRAEFLPKMFGPDLVRAFGEFKSIWDPQGKMNPGKIVQPYRIDENLRLGTSYDPPQVKTHFKFPEDKGSLPYATLRCVGIGNCRKKEQGTMCPSFMVTLEEKHSTRGRARLLFEMFQGGILKDAWKSSAVKEALDLCLACKGCKAECPTNVDMATYKSEFLSHYYEGRARPLTAYSMGMVDQWARLGSKIPGLVNFVTQTPGLREVAKRLAGVASQRQIPMIASQSFKDWFSRRAPRNAGCPELILWVDTFNNYFHPEVAKAALEVLEAARFRVLVPPQHLCCGRPLYDYGMLDLAKIYLQRTLGILESKIQAGVPVVGLEPSCVAVFRDELVSLLPNDANARRLANQTLILSEFLEKHATHFRIPRLKGKALVHGHCHQKAVLTMKDEQGVLDRLGLDYRISDSGCCGMAGSFGFEAADEHYEVSMRAGERVLLPEARGAASDTLVITNGFSCRTQITQATQRKPLHLAQVLQMAIQAEDARSPEKREQMDTQNGEAARANAERDARMDANDSFNRALAESRGGSIFGAAVRGWVQQHQIVIAGVSAMLAAAGILTLRRNGIWPQQQRT
ncbi:MAG: FAD-binding protein [Deltaproteobacteria bacterium]|nr:FAD-binding protein [Deltaproteobacteria bacterium]